MNRSGIWLFTLCLLVGLALAHPFTVDDDDVSDDVSDDRSMLPFVLRQAPLRSQISWLSRDPKGKALYPAAGKEKRAGLGRCIHNCMHSGGGLNFMQCKIMCLCSSGPQGTVSCSFKDFIRHIKGRMQGARDVC